MKNTSKAVDAYIAKSAPFARPILERVRRVFHKGCPEVTEGMKWGTPFFEYKGMLGGMAAFKEHCRLIFWKAQLMRDPDGLFVDKGSMGALKIASVDELPPEKVLVAYVKEAAALNENNVKAPRPQQKPAAKELVVPDYFAAALRKNKKALATFEKFSYSHRKEYVEWITEAKQEATRAKRLATAIEWLAEGKPRNWKYMKEWSK